MTDTRRIPARLRKPYVLKRTPLRRSGKRIRRVGRMGMKRAIRMEAARRAYVAKFGYVADGQSFGLCQLCGKMVHFDLHHKLKRSLGGDEQDGNLIALCRFHHDLTHSKREFYEAIRDSEADVTNGYRLQVVWSGIRHDTDKRSTNSHLFS